MCRACCPASLLTLCTLLPTTHYGAVFFTWLVISYTALLYHAVEDNAYAHCAAQYNCIQVSTLNALGLCAVGLQRLLCH